jgi:cytochrome c553
MLLNQKNKRILLNIVFVLISVTILTVLWNAPEETTSKLPLDENHMIFQQGMDKKEAESRCSTCHQPAGISPLPENHPPKYRCLFCHKRQ